jgi:hypothetical protein
MTGFPFLWVIWLFVCLVRLNATVLLADCIHGSTFLSPLLGCGLALITLYKGKNSRAFQENESDTLSQRLVREHRLNTWYSLTCQPFLNGLTSMTVTAKIAFFCNPTLSVRLNMREPNNGQAMTLQNAEAAQGFTAERVLRRRPNSNRLC